MTHNEFIFWLQGFLDGKNNLNTSQILSIQKKMEKIKDEVDYSEMIKKNNPSHFFNPLQVSIVDKPNEDDNLGKPPKIVM